MIAPGYTPQPGDRASLPVETLDAVMQVLMTLPAGQVMDLLITVREQAELVKE